MRIIELKGTKEDPIRKMASDNFKRWDPDADREDDLVRQMQVGDFVKLMKKNGFKSLGSGNWGAVFEKPGYPWVFKVYKDDKAYEAFVNYALQNKNNPNLPRFKGRPVKIGPGTYVVRTEKLQPLGDTHDMLQRILEHLSQSWARVNDIQAEIPMVADFLKKNYPGIFDFIVHATRTKEYDLDLYRGNVMRRGRIPVLVDPFAQ